MRFTIERAHLLKTLSHVQSIVEKRNTIPVLSNVKIETMGDGISFKATDMDTEITEIADAKITEAGATTAPAHMLYQFLLLVQSFLFQLFLLKIFRLFQVISCLFLLLWQKMN